MEQVPGGGYLAVTGPTGWLPTFAIQSGAPAPVALTEAGPGPSWVLVVVPPAIRVTAIRVDVTNVNVAVTRLSASLEHPRRMLLTPGLAIAVVVKTEGMVGVMGEGRGIVGTTAGTGALGPSAGGSGETG